ncbi:MAG: branched-chain amino acid ABC transporter permease [Nitrososphaeria archaeon]
MVLETIFGLVFYGLLLGGIYALVSVGLSLIYGIMRIVNFAQGEFFMIGAFTCYYMITLLNMHPILAVLASALVTFIIGSIMNQLVVSPLRRRGGREWLMNTLVVTLGASLIIQNFALMIFGAYHRGVPYLWAVGSLEFLGIRCSIDRFVIFITSIAAILIFYMFLFFTRIGKAIRATAQNKNAAMSVGINVNVVYTLAFSLSTMLAGVAGALMLPISAVYPTVGSSYILFCFTVIIIGGLGKLNGTLFASFLVGIIHIFSLYYFGMGWSYFVLFIMVGIILLIRPAGIFGEGK